MEGTYVYLWLIHIDVGQKPTQHCNAIKKETDKFIKVTKIQISLKL